MRPQSRQDERDAEGGIQPQRQNSKAHQAADKRGEEADEHRVLRVREDDGRVQRRDGAGNDLGGNALEGGHQLAEDGAHAEEDDGDGYAELQALGHRLHEVVAHVFRATLEGTKRLLGPRASDEQHGENDVHQRHRQGSGHHRVAQEPHPLREFELLGGRALAAALTAYCRADRPSGDVAGGTEVSDSNGVITRYLPRPRVGDGRQGHHEDAQE